MTDFQHLLEQNTQFITQVMDDLLPEVNERVGERRLARAMRYSVMNPGKRLRPFLVLTSANLFGVDKDAASQAAAAVEFIHVYSLIHDDLPALDDDDERRGKPSCHVEFDEATAILAGNALFTLAMEIVSHSTTHSDANVRADLVQALTLACGVKGMMGGQMIDLLAEDRNLTIEEITRLQQMKTGALFEVSCEAGAILGKAPANLRAHLKRYAHDIGLAFQITDDLLDYQDEQDGVGERKDPSEQGTYVSALGVNHAKQQADILCDQAINHLSTFDHRADPLRELAHFVVKRTL